MHTEQNLLDHLLQKLEALHNSNEAVSPEDLCKETPNLIPELKRRWGERRKQLAEALIETRSIIKEYVAPETKSIIRSPYSPIESDVRLLNFEIPRSKSGQSRFQNFKKHAQGGLGVVYRADDLELKRSVAYKQIKADRAHEPEKRARFVREAEITGGLEHPGVVPIYSLGADEEGHPFYAMRFIQGKSLSDAIREFHKNKNYTPAERTLEFRKLLTRFIGVCQALAYAHSKNILHRDLKPDNIMLGEFGETLVVDWGLAKRLPEQEASSSDTSASQSTSPTGSNLSGDGDIMGTPNYMAPEQAAGEINTLTSACDIYALGATLYAILTNQAPYIGGDGLEIVKRVRQGNFPAPRSIAPTIPKPLEAICIKAMAKAPQSRYTTAKALAEELEKYLGDEPVTAYHETLYERSRRWMRKHPAMVTSTAVAMVLGICAVSMIAYMQGAHAKELNQKNVDLGIAKNKAEERELDAIAAVKRFGDAVVNNPELKNNPKLEPLRKELLKEPIGFFKLLKHRLQSDNSTRMESKSRLADAAFRLGQLTDEIGDKQVAISAYGEAAAILEPLSREKSSITEFQDVLASSHNNLGMLLRETGKPAEAVAAWEKANAIWERLTHENPSEIRFQSDLANIQSNLGLMFSETGKLAEALIAHDQAKKIRERLARQHPSMTEFQQALAVSHNNLGALLRAIGKPAEAVAAWEEAKAIWERLTRENPAVKQFQSDLASSHNNLGALHRETGRRVEAIAAFEQAKTIQERLAREYPSATQIQNHLARTHLNLGALLSDARKTVEALAAYQQAMEIQLRLVRENPSVIDFQSDLALSHFSVGLLHRATGDAEESLTAFEHAKHIQEHLARENPSATQIQRDLARSHNALATLLIETGKPSEALTSFEQAKAVQERLAREHPSVTEYHSDLARSHHNLGTLHGNTGKPAEAIAAYELAIAIQQRLVQENPSITEFKYALGSALYNLASIHLETERYGKALDFLQAAVTQQRMALAGDSRNPKYREHLKRYLTTLLIAAEKVSDLKLVEEANQELVDLATGDPQFEALSIRLAAVLGGEPVKDLAELLSFGQRSYELRRFAQAAQFFDEAIKRDMTLAEDRETQIPYNAACSAALAASGQGEPDPPLDDAAKTKLRSQALTWLKHELTQWQKFLGDDPKPDAKQTVAQTLAHWQQDSDLTFIRDPKKLSDLPETERKEWEALWTDVKALQAKVAAEPVATPPTTDAPK